MKKKLKLLFLFFMMWLPFLVKAYGIDNYYIDSTIEENGDLLVQEYFSLTGEFNGFERIILYENDDLYEFDPAMTSFGGSLIHNGSELEILEVKALPIDSNFTFDNVGGDLFSKIDSAAKGDYGVYEENTSIGGKSLLIYNPSDYNKAFYIKYRVKNIAIRHNDIGEIGWNVVGNELSESVGNLKIYLHIPNNTNVRAWAHGPYNGKVNIIDQETILFTISNLSSYRAVDIRATFDLNVINNSTKYTNTDALDKIILYETDKAEQANYERQNQAKINLQNASETLSNFEVNVTRYNYDEAKECIELLDSSDVKTEYLLRLEKTKLELDVMEEKDARQALSYVKEDLSYYWYESAKSKIEILDNVEVKTELLKELVVVEEKIKENELKVESKNYFLGFLLIVFILGIGYLIYKKYIKDPDTEFNYKYFREIPSDYSPETVSYLFHKKIINQAMSATLLDLINRKIIIAEKLTYNNYKLTLNENGDNLVTNVESRLLDLIFNGESSIETKDMKRNARKNYDDFISKWNSYEKAAFNNAKQNSFFEKDEKFKSSNKKSFSSKYIIIILCLMPLLLFSPMFLVLIMMYFVPVIIINLITSYTSKIVTHEKKTSDQFIFVIVLLVCAGISIYSFISILVFQKFYNQSFLIYIIALVLSIILIPFIFYTKKRTQKGALEYKKWKALKNFLNDFGRFSDKEVPEVVLWEKYLVYATLFGCAKRVIDVMKVKIVDVPNDYFDTYLDLYIMNTYISSAIRSSYSYAQSAYAAAHSSSSSGGGFSSGSGGGGGFSSGGGSFGGGGGGGRF